LASPVPDGVEAAGDILEKPDIALYKSKQSGRDRVSVCMAKCYSGSDGQLVKAAAMRFPAEPAEVGAADEGFTGNF
jgi:hypothetical protein